MRSWLPIPILDPSEDLPTDTEGILGGLHGGGFVVELRAREVGENILVSLADEWLWKSLLAAAKPSVRIPMVEGTLIMNARDYADLRKVGGTEDAPLLPADDIELLRRSHMAHWGPLRVVCSRHCPDGQVLVVSDVACATRREARASASEIRSGDLGFEPLYRWEGECTVRLQVRDPNGICSIPWPYAAERSNPRTRWGSTVNLADYLEFQ